MKQTIRDISKLLLVLGFLVWISFTINLIEKKNEIIYAEVVKTDTVYVDREVPVYVYISSDFSKENTLNYMRSKGISEELIAWWSDIIQRESEWVVDATPDTYVMHCMRPNGTWFATELTNGIQDYCENHGAIEGHREKSYGLFQILPSTFKRYGCTGSIKNWENQVSCALVLYERDGDIHWTTAF